jgi:hypothetical protein
MAPLLTSLSFPAALSLWYYMCSRGNNRLPLTSTFGRRRLAASVLALQLSLVPEGGTSTSHTFWSYGLPPQIVHVSTMSVRTPMTFTKSNKGWAPETEPNMIRFLLREDRIQAHILLL